MQNPPSKPAQCSKFPSTVIHQAYYQIGLLSVFLSNFRLISGISTCAQFKIRALFCVCNKTFYVQRKMCRAKATHTPSTCISHPPPKFTRFRTSTDKHEPHSSIRLSVSHVNKFPKFCPFKEVIPLQLVFACKQMLRKGQKNNNKMSWKLPLPSFQNIALDL